MSIIDTFVEHNGAGYWALEHSLIGKKKSIICMSLTLATGLTSILMKFIVGVIINFEGEVCP